LFRRKLLAFGEGELQPTSQLKVLEADEISTSSWLLDTNIRGKRQGLAWSRPVFHVRHKAPSVKTPSKMKLISIGLGRTRSQTFPVVNVCWVMGAQLESLHRRGLPVSLSQK
jgi:hypothetical protein